MSVSPSTHLKGDARDQRALVAQIATGHTPPLAPTIRLTRPDSAAVDVGVWCAATNIAREDLRSFAVALGGQDDAATDELMPVPGTGGWQLAEFEPSRVYSVDDLRWATVPIYGGELDPALLAREIEIALSAAGKETKPGRWTNTKMTVGTLLRILTMHEAGEKDGGCFLQGYAIDGMRLAKRNLAA